jgi:hypothetical protein
MSFRNNGQNFGDSWRLLNRKEFALPGVLSIEHGRAQSTEQTTRSSEFAAEIASHQQQTSEQHRDT